MVVSDATLTAHFSRPALHHVSHVESNIMNILRRWAAGVRARDESGQTMAEYAVVISVITATIVASFALLSSSSSDIMQQVTNTL